MLVKQAVQILNPVPFSKEAGLKEKRIIPLNNEQFRFLRFRAIANMCKNGGNGNGDCFPVVYFEDSEPGFGYKSFIGKRAHTEHNSILGDKGAIGELTDAYLNRFIYPEEYSGKSWKDLGGKENAHIRQAILDMPGQKDGAIEVLMKIDASRLKRSDLDPTTRNSLERIIKMIDTGQKLACSMGTNIAYSHCSTCGNKAVFAADYCSHMKRGSKLGLSIVNANQTRDLLDKDILRPEWLPHIVASKHDVDEILNGISNKGVAVRNLEINHKLSFFELSVVKVPAYEQADALEKVASAVDGDYLEYLKQQRKILGDNVLIDIFGQMQNDGIIHSSCDIGEFK